MSEGDRYVLLAAEGGRHGVVDRRTRTVALFGGPQNAAVAQRRLSSGEWRRDSFVWATLESLPGYDPGEGWVRAGEGAGLTKPYLAYCSEEGRITYWARERA